MSALPVSPAANPLKDVRWSVRGGGPMPDRLERLGIPGRLELVQAADLVVDPKYQRTLRLSHAQRIAKNYDDSLLGVFWVSLRSDGRSYLLDGQHRLEALRIIGEMHKQVPSIVYEGLTAEQEAQIFALTQDRSGRINLRAVDLYRAKLAAGDETATWLSESVREVGFGIEDVDTGGNTGIRCVEELMKMSSRANQRPQVKALLRFCADVWGVERGEQLQAKLLRGLTQFFAEYQDQINHKRLIAKLQETTPGQLVAEGDRIRSIVGGTAAAGVKRAVHKQHNLGARGPGRLPEG
jgi:hypothetical protein